MKTTSITVDWSNEASIRAAEKAKESLENDGYELVNQFGGAYHSVLIYGDKNDCGSEAVSEGRG